MNSGGPTVPRMPPPISAVAGLLPSAGASADFDVVHPEYLIPPDHPVRGMSRTEAGLVLDRELVKLAGIDHRCRLIQAQLTRRFMETRAWTPAGFVRLSDYARERLGYSSRVLEEDARVLKRLDGLPLLRSALEAAALSWTQARLLVRIATPEGEAELLERAGSLSTRELEAFVKAGGASGTSADAAVAADSSLSPVRDTDSPADAATVTNSSSNAAASTDCSADAGTVAVSSAELDAAAEASPEFAPITDASLIDEEAGEPIVRWSSPVSPTGLRTWRSVCEVARRMAGTSLSSAQVLELVVAEAASGEATGTDPLEWIPSAESLEQRLMHSRRRDENVLRRSLEAFRAEVGVLEGFEWLDPASREPGPAEQLDALLDSVDTIDAHELDRRLREVRRVAQRIDYQIGALARLGSDRRLFREVGFATLNLYVESRLGCCSRRIWSLIAIERETWRRGGAFRKAWKEGRLSHLAALTLVPVMDEIHGEAWIRRAGEVTLRRLEDEVAWALDHGERPWLSSMPAPPPADAAIPPGGLSSVDLHEVQMRAHGESSRDDFGPGGNGRLAFRVPISVAVLLEIQIRRYRHRRDPDWRAFERVVAHALLEWTSAPKHRDPVFERDGFRCAVPGCRSRCNLHDHHLVFRSLGGDHARDNRITVCAAHHLHGIHAGIIRAEGRAPDRLEWEMGCAPGKRPLMRLHGDRYVDADAYEDAA
jgi:hypothetical protein